MTNRIREAGPGMCPGSGTLVTSWSHQTGETDCPVCGRRALVLATGAPHLWVSDHVPPQGGADEGNQPT